MRASIIATSLILAFAGFSTSASATTFSAWGHDFTYPNPQEASRPIAASTVVLRTSVGRQFSKAKLTKLSNS